MKEREIIIGLLRSIGRRLWMGRAVREVLFGACLLLFFLVAFKLAGAVQPAGIPTSGIAAKAAIVLAVIAIVAYLAWRMSREVTLGQAAAHADARAVLHDELKSAYWFVSHDETSPFIAAQVSRAAVTAGRLDPRALVPARPPRSLQAAIALGLLLAFVAWLAPQMTPYRDASAAPAPTLAQEQDLLALLKDAPRDAQVEKLARALETLQSTEATAEQKREAMQAMREASEQSNMEALAARDGLARLAETLATNPQLADVAEALKAGNAAEAIEKLQELRRSLPGEDKQDGQFPEAGLGTQTQGSVPEQLDRVGQSLAGHTPELNGDAVGAAIRKIEEAARQMEIQNRIEQVKQGAKERLSVSSQRSSAKANAFGSNNNLEAGNPTPAPENGNTDMAGGAMFNSGKANREEDADGAQEGSRTGSAAGESESMALQGKATQRLDAQLKREAIANRDENRPEDEQDGKDWIYTGSQEQASALQYEQVRARGGFDRESAGARDSIPVRQKQVVKNYFLNLHESEKR
jgi:hypothetical protein